MDLNQYDEAVTALEQAIRLEPDRAEAHYNLGVLLADAGRLAEAIEAFRRAVALDPANESAREQPRVFP